MKKLFLILVSMFTLSGILVAKPALSEKEILKMAKKEAKRLKKDGWTVAPGALPMEVQLQRRYTKEYDLDDNKQNLYYLGNSQPTAQFFDAASLQAAALCKLDIAGQLGGKMKAIIEAEVGNKQTSGAMSTEEAVSVAQVTAAISEIVQANLRDIIPLFEVMKKLPNGNVQIQRTVAYARSMAEKAAKEAVAGELEKKMKGLSKKLDSLK
jgi:uncharacterized membrane protein